MKEVDQGRKCIELSLRVHHVYDFIRALVSDTYREKYINDGLENQFKALRTLLQSISDDSMVRIVLGKDDICFSCDVEKSQELEEACSWDDSVFACDKLLAKAIPGEIITIRRLKEQYFLYRRAKKKMWRKNQLHWKHMILQSRGQNKDINRSDD